jgi:hypothetical protein
MSQENATVELARMLEVVEEDIPVWRRSVLESGNEAA